jgi:hypothetical protein
VTAAGRCLVCNVICISAEAWMSHMATVHASNGDIVCALCGGVYARTAFATHPCVGEFMSATERARQLHPSTWPRRVAPSSPPRPVSAGEGTVSFLSRPSAVPSPATPVDEDAS